MGRNSIFAICSRLFTNFAESITIFFGENNKKYVFLILAVLIPYFFLTFGPAWKDDRFIVPLYPIIALISAIVIHELSKKVLEIVIIFLLGSLNFLGASWGVGPMKFSITGDKFTVPHSIVMPMPIGHPRRVWLAPISWPPRPNEGNADRILELVLQDSKEKKKPTLLLTFSVPQIEGPLYTTVLYEQRGLINLRALWGFNANDYTTLFERIENADYMLIKEGGIFDDQFDNQPDLLQTFNYTMRSPQAKLPASFIKLREIGVPFDESKVIIFKKAHKITAEEWEEFANLFLIMNNTHTEFIQKAISTVGK